jgi:hypothetical protein
MAEPDYIIRAMDSINDSEFTLQKTFIGRVSGDRFYSMICKNNHLSTLSASSIKRKAAPIKCKRCALLQN